MDRKKLIYAAETLTDFMKRMIANGEIISDESTKEKRLEICKACQKYTELKQCLECGCWMDFKIPLASAKCPLGKW